MKTNQVITTIFLLISLVSCKNKYTKEIEKTCVDCIQKEIPKSKLILVTNHEGKSNVFHKEKFKYLLSDWYPAKFDEGVIYDDIKFTINGQQISCIDSEYDKLSDTFLLKNEDDSNSISNEEAPDGYKRGGSCEDCEGTGRYTRDLLGMPNSKGDVCAACNGKGFHWVEQK